MGLHLLTSIPNYIYIITSTITTNILMFFLVHIFLGVILTNIQLKANLKFDKNWIFLYFISVNFFLLLILIFKMYLSVFYDAAGGFFYERYGCVSVFSDTLICLSLTVTVISWLYLSERYLFKESFFIFYFFIFGTCTILMVSTSNLLQMFVYFEFIFLPSLFFVYQFGYSKKVTKSILFLLTWTLTGSFLVFIAITYLYGVYGTLDIVNLSLLKFSYTERLCLFFCFFIGFAIKIPLWPFYYWLIKVHVEAPTGFSIFLSGFLVKTAFYCLTFFYSLFYSVNANILVLSLIIWGAYDASVRMWSSLDIKKLIAYATVQEMNLIALFLVLLGSLNLNMLNLFLLVHGLLSALFFYLIDQVQKQFGSRNATLLSGLSLFTPLLTVIIWAGLLIFRGFPIFVKFLIEWELLHLLYVNFAWLGIFFFLLCAAYGVLGFCKVWFTAIYGASSNLNNSFDILKKDLVTGVFLVNSLLTLSLFVAYF